MRCHKREMTRAGRKWDEQRPFKRYCNAMLVIPRMVYARKICSLLCTFADYLPVKRTALSED